MRLVREEEKAKFAKGRCCSTDLRGGKLGKAVPCARESQSKREKIHRVGRRNGRGSKNKTDRRKGRTRKELIQQRKMATAFLFDVWVVDRKGRPPTIGRKALIHFPRRKTSV